MSVDRIPINAEGQLEPPAMIYEGDRIKLIWDDRLNAQVAVIERSGSAKESYTFYSVTRYERSA